MIYILIFFLIVLFFFLFVLYRFNIYISLIEKKINEQIILIENLKQSLKEIVAEGFLENDGRLKKFAMPNRRNIIYNGSSLIKENPKELI